MASSPPLTLNVVGSDPNADANTFPTVTSSLTPPSPRRSSPLQNLSPSILIIVTVLAVTVIVSLALCFLLRHLNRRCLRRFSSSSAAPSAAATPIFSSSRRISPEIVPSSAAAAASASVVIDKLPLFTFSSVTRRSAGAAADCAVCLSKFHHHDLLRLLPLCCHAFHAECIDTWLQSNLSCPLCRSAIVAEDSDLAKIHRQPSSAGSSDSFRLELGNISRRGTDGSGAGSAGAATGIVRGGSRSYSIGSFEYLIDDESEVPFSHARGRSVDDAKEFPAAANENEASLAGEVGGVRSWLKDYMDRFSASISSRTASFRSSGRFFSGGGTSGRRSDVVPVAAEYDIEGNRIGEEISEMFRWLSGV